MCEACGADYPKWQGQCSACGEWNQLKEFRLGSGRAASARHRGGYAGSESQVHRLADVDVSQAPRFSSGIAEFDRVLGGGVVPGSVSLIGGDPGAGKSTLLLQVAAAIGAIGGQDSTNGRVLYVTGEESLEQLAGRAKRLSLDAESLLVASEVIAERVAELVQSESPRLVIVDSIQVMRLEDVDGTPGSISQVRETAGMFTQSGTLIGSVTQEGLIRNTAHLGTNR